MMIPKQRKLVRVGLVGFAGVALVATACSAPRSVDVQSGAGVAKATTSVSQATSTTAPPAPGAVQSVSPIADFMGEGTGPTSSQEYQNAAQKQVGACMSAKGWTYEVARVTAAKPNSPAARIAAATQSGYEVTSKTGPDPIASGRVADDKNGDYQRNLSADDLQRYLTDLNGPDKKGGCRAVATAALDAHFPMKNPALTAEVIKRQKAETADPRLGPALKLWVSCMSAKSFSFKSPSEARGHFMGADGKVAANVTKDDEIKVASADAECAKDTLWPATSEVESQIVTDVAAKFGHDSTCGASC